MESGAKSAAPDLFTFTFISLLEKEGKNDYKQQLRGGGGGGGNRNDVVGVTGIKIRAL